MKLKLIVCSVLLILFSSFYACKNSEKKSDTANTGSIAIACDENIKPIIEAQIDVFTSIYPRAQFSLKSSSEQEIFNSFMNDTTRLIIALRDLNKEEFNFFAQSKLSVKTNIMATDGIAFLINNNQQDTSITYQNLAKILNGEITDWKFSTGNSGPVTLVIDNPASGTARYLKEKLGEKALSNTNVYAVNTTSEVVSFIEKNKNAIGIIGANWISDSGDSTSEDYLSRIKILAISSSVSTDKGNLTYYKPSQGDLREGNYPFIRNVYVISKESRTGLGTGFASFMGGERGQRIFLKGGLMPATMPSRELNFNN